MSLTKIATEILEAAKAIDRELGTKPRISQQYTTNPSFTFKFSRKSCRVRQALKSFFCKSVRSSHRNSALHKGKHIDSVSRSSGESEEIPELSLFERYSQLPENQNSTRDKLLDKCHQIKALIETPEAALINIYTNWTELVSLETICHFRLFEAIPPTGSATYSEIAAYARIPRDFAVRFIRINILNGIFSEPVPGHVYHTPRSRWLLTRGPGLLDLIEFNCRELAPAGLQYPEVIERYGAAQEPNQSPFALANDNLPFFEVLARDEKRRLRFSRGMQYLTSAECYDVRYILEGYDWAAVDTPGSRVLDVGGGLGHISALIAASTKELHFTVQDLPPVIADAVANKSDLAEPCFLDRISFLPLSFFTPHPISTPAFDVVFLRWITHNWSDKYTCQIFRAMIPALRKGSEVLIIEYLLDDQCFGVNVSHAFSLRIDMMMGVGFGAKERSARGIRELMNEVAQEFGGSWSNWSVTKPKSSLISFIRAVWDGV
ncbi:hypothetical protein Golomagni_01849 [Golovinomyces magnicellulatus]|nr:hypothetical protein Golomagni_01849 [Golovinomyces magnicellulatus]